jgi:UDP-galactopyranose mutase
MTVLVVGAGLAGLVVARRLAEQDYRVTVIDKRDHVAGNAFDEVKAGVRVHRYGPHLFHTSNMAVVDWLSRFTEWTPYEHRVTARLEDGRAVPLPINRRTLEALSGEDLADAGQAEAYLASVAETIADPQNARDYLYSKIGRQLTELFFGRYTRKMWGHDLSEMSASVIKRIPIRYDDETRYFPNDTFQALPTRGYTQLALNILDHPNIETRTGVAFEKSMLAQYEHGFLSLPIDEYYDNVLGPLPYRSIRFHHASVARYEVGMETPTVNFTDEGPRTRKTAWHMLPDHDVAGDGTVIVTSEEPCDYTENDLERYYPVNTADGRYRKRYEDYAALAAKEDGITFIGRCGTYQYLDMHQVINQTQILMDRWLAARADAA